MPRTRTRHLILIAAALLAAPAGARAKDMLRVCADPNNLPYSNSRREGFENKIVELVAEELGAGVAYEWRPQRRGFLRETLLAGRCDLVPGAPSSLERVRTTRPYYRSSFVFVTRADGPQISSLNDPALRKVTIGLQFIGDDGANSPPGAALARRGVVENVRGYSLYGDYAKPNPPARIVEAVAHSEVDVAVVWGPLGGYFAARQTPPLHVTPVTPIFDGPRLPMAWDISMATRKDTPKLLHDVEAALAKNRSDIDRILAAFHVPRLDKPSRDPPQQSR